MPERTWKAAFVEVSRAAARHKLASGLIAVAVVGSFGIIAWAGTSHAPAAVAAGEEVGAVRPAGSPAAAAFNVPQLDHSGVGTGHVSLASYLDKPLIVNFFASWCTPCKQETPLLAKFYRTERGKVALVGLDENDVVANAQKFASADGVTYPVGWDPQVAVAAAYGVNAMPQTFFLNARHHIVYQVYGAVTTAELREGIALATAAGL